MYIHTQYPKNYNATGDSPFPSHNSNFYSKKFDRYAVRLILKDGQGIRKVSSARKGFLIASRKKKKNNNKKKLPSLKSVAVLLSL